MIRRLFKFATGVVAAVVGVWLLSFVWQFGYVGATGSIGLRLGEFWHVSRTDSLYDLDPVSLDGAPMHPADGIGLYIQKADTVNRAMYWINGKATWSNRSLRHWVLPLALAWGYVAFVAVVRSKWKRRSPRWLTLSLATTGSLFVAFWLTSHVASVTYSTSSFSANIGEGRLRLSFGRPPTYGGSPLSGWSMQRSTVPFLNSVRGYTGSIPALGRMPSWYYVPEPIFGSYSGWKQLSLPLWMLALMSLAPAILFARWSRQLQPGYCRKCGYDLTGNASGVCPECGRAITIDSSNPQAKSSED